MQGDGLTNDEVKSHLQKYRLHVQGDLFVQGLLSIGDDGKVAKADEESDGHSCKDGFQEP
ncbi:hypothetical protein CIPAW_14G096000 [Carya illinoinensis]|uniref:Uncharacterized protein n=1 Tax=Carya illinoinensis TaxID=32201 RepID=A0A8T1ND29_CARIL|nr:hypothetical protein CIPAW_14G096000 [Carya illinoinensis]